MPWFKVDDTFAFHPKVLAAGNAAVGLWCRAGAWSMQQLTDGYIPANVVKQLGGTAPAKKLVEAGLWVKKDDGYAFHEWDQRQPSRARLMAEREANAARLQKWREKKRRERGDEM